ncbi:thiopurine S-methyltransferase [Azonexus caeni]|jgi:thiopurine S-methyltransferase|uniref:thiopurine S-methyltransferase n=1 Tax=Azonexus caeni TaxID=266126 RepID=UPI003A84C045
MDHPDQLRWKQNWRANRIDFHLDHVHPLLQRCWAEVGVAPAARVFVPLCGKSLDLMWLHGQGHDIVGVELSTVAVNAFFRESRLRPQRSAHGALECWAQERLTIHCGDFFALRREDLAGVSAVYDRAALTALPEALRPAYVAHLRAILPDDCRILLLTVEDLDDGESEADASGSSAEVEGLYAAHFRVRLLHVEHCAALLAGNGTISEPRSVHKAYLLGGDESAPPVPISD